jgi:hypothetical protein
LRQILSYSAILSFLIAELAFKLLVWRRWDELDDRRFGSSSWIREGAVEIICRVYISQSRRGRLNLSSKDRFWQSSRLIIEGIVTIRVACLVFAGWSRSMLDYV